MLPPALNEGVAASWTGSHLSIQSFRGDLARVRLVSGLILAGEVEIRT